MYKIDIAKDFSEYPGLRYCSLSDNSGEEFYHNILNQKFKEALVNNKKLIVNLDNTSGFAPSFLDETFGNLIYDFGIKNVEKYIEIISIQEPYWKEMLYQDTFINWEKRRLDKLRPKVTKKHKEWYRIINDKIIKEVWEQPIV